MLLSSGYGDLRQRQLSGNMNSSRYPISGPEQLQHALVADDCSAEEADPPLNVGCTAAAPPSVSAQL
jgi:hypothetical protein